MTALWSKVSDSGSIRGLQHNKVCVAIARELLGFVWDIGQHVAPEG